MHKNLKHLKMCIKFVQQTTRSVLIYKKKKTQNGTYHYFLMFVKLGELVMTSLPKKIGTRVKQMQTVFVNCNISILDKKKYAMMKTVTFSKKHTRCTEWHGCNWRWWWPGRSNVVTQITRKAKAGWIVKYYISRQAPK